MFLKTPKLANTTTSGSVQISVNDIDNDGNFDFFFTGKTGSNRLVRFGEENGTFTEQSGSDDILSGISGDDYDKVTFGDIDGDGDLDALISQGSSPISFQTYINSADNFVQIAQSSDDISLSTNAGMNSHRLIDFDEDGDDDLIVNIFSGSENQLTVYENDQGNIKSANGSFSFFTTLSNDLDSINRFVSLSVVDFDGDNDEDIFAFQHGSGPSDPEIFYYENSGDQLIAASNVTNTIFNNVKRLALNDYATFDFADLDGDGDQDLIRIDKVESFSLPVKIYENVEGTFQDRTLRVGYGKVSPTLTDLDNDGDQDLAISYFDPRTELRSVKYFKNENGKFNFEAGQEPSFENVEGIGTSGDNYSGSIRFSDIDSDGIEGFDLTISTNNELQSITSEGSSFSSSSLGVDLSSYFFETIDIDNDGDSDIVGGSSDQSIEQFNNDGDNANFTTIANTDADFAFDSGATSDFHFARLAKFDFDLDGDMDLLAIHGDSGSSELHDDIDNFSLLLNNSGDFETIGSSNTTNSANYLVLAGIDLTSVSLHNFTLGDLNDDGLADMVYTLDGDDQIYVLESNYSGDFIAENSKLQPAVAFDSNQTQSGELTFTWSDNSVLNNPTYTFELATDQNFSGTVYTQTTDQTSILVNPGAVLTNDTSAILIDWNNFNPNTLIAADHSDLKSSNTMNQVVYYALFCLLLLALTAPFSAKSRSQLAAAIAFLLLLFAGCSSDDNEDSSSSSTSDDATTYYWKVTAEADSKTLSSPSSSFKYEK